MPKQPIIVFDVNETLLDLDTLHPTLDRIFGDPAALRLWFANLITYSEALTLAGLYVPFTDIGAAVVRVREAGGTVISEPARQPYGLVAECTDDQGGRFYLGEF